MEENLAEFYAQGTEDVTIESEAECLENGDIKLTFAAENTSSETRGINYKIRTSAVYYTGVVGNHLHTKKESMTLDPGESRHYTLTSTVLHKIHI